MDPSEHERPIIMKKGKPLKKKTNPLFLKPPPFFRPGKLSFRQRYFWPLTFALTVGVFALYQKYSIDMMDEELIAHRKEIKERELQDFETMMEARLKRKREFKIYKPPAE